MAWKITRWLMNRKKKYVVFIHYGEKQYWDNKTRDWKWSYVKSRFTSQIMELRVWDVKHNSFTSYEKWIWEDMLEKERPLYYVSITGIIKV